LEKQFKTQRAQSNTKGELKLDQIKKSSGPFKLVPLDVEAIGKKVLDASYTAHSALGPGLLESVYEACLAFELEKQGLNVETQVVVPVKYQEVFVETGLRLDLWVEKSVIVELKAVETIHPLYEAQLLTYLKITGCRLGFLINFNVKRLKDGIKRMVV
jgi:GxxExxY protein